MDVYLVDGTYELFRHFYALPSHVTRSGREVAATRGVLGSVLGMLESGVTHLGVATDHVIESFRNGMWAGYKTGEGIDPRLWEQFPLLEEALQAMGVVVWPMVELEADDALGAGAVGAGADPAVDRVLICTPDKDLAQCVVGERIVQMDRRNRKILDEAGVVAKFGVSPASIPDFLALVGDSADGYPGLPGWGAKTAAALLARYAHIEAIPDDGRLWNVALRGADRLARLASTLAQQRTLAYLFRDLATLRTDSRVFDSVEELRWMGATEAFAAHCESLEEPRLLERAMSLGSRR